MCCGNDEPFAGLVNVLKSNNICNVFRKEAEPFAICFPHIVVVDMRIVVKHSARCTLTVQPTLPRDDTSVLFTGATHVEMVIASALKNGQNEMKTVSFLQAQNVGFCCK